MPVFTLSNYRALAEGKLAQSPSVLQLLQTGFPAKLFFFFFQWLNRDQEAVRYTEAQLAKERGECPGELSMSITSDYSQFYPQDFEEKASNGKLPAVYSEWNKRVSVSFWKCSKRTFSLSEFGQTLKPESNFLTVQLGVYINLCILDIWWHMLSSTAKIKVQAKCWKPLWWRVGVCVTVLN